MSDSDLEATYEEVLREFAKFGDQLAKKEQTFPERDPCEAPAEKLGGSFAGLLEGCSTKILTVIDRLRREIGELRLRVGELTESERIYRCLFENSRDAIIFTTPEGDFIDVNSAFVELMGFHDKQEILQKKIQDFYADPKERFAMIEKVDRSGATANFELRFRRKDGTEIDSLHAINARVDKDGRICGYQGIMRDITDRKMAEKALKQSHNELEMRVAERTAEIKIANMRLRDEIAERSNAQEALSRSEARLRSIFETATECMFIKDSSLRYTLANPYMANLLELQPSKIIGRTDEELFGAVAGDHLRHVDKRVLRGETIEEEHTRPVRGIPTTFLDIRSPMRDDRGNIVGICGISRNITERSMTRVKSYVALEEYPSAAMRSTLTKALLAAGTDLIVLITGESGTGKDYLARYIHGNSMRAGGPFYSVNCAAIPPDLAESELFGHEAGAFSGAIRRKRGLVELAEGGTLLLNEIGELPLRLQAKLLTFLDTYSITRVGGEKTITVSARIMAATNRNLDKEVAAGRFRQDLFYRLNVFSIEVPPLRERSEDIPFLTRQILSQLAEEMRLPERPRIASEDMDNLLRYSWQGNVRELRNVLERATILSKGSYLRFDVPTGHRSEAPSALWTIHFPPRPSLIGAVTDMRRKLVQEALRHSGGNKMVASRLLGISRYTLRRQMKALGMNGRNPHDN